MAAAPGTRTRRDVWKLPQWDPILLWYAKAVADMQTRPINDPTSWRYQAAIHGYDPSEDPFASPSDTMPSSTEQHTFWSQCQHSSWFFLPWHRMYLVYFEQMVAATVRKLGGPDDWALPYWNYSDAGNPDAFKLPAAFWAASLPDGSPNALNVAARAPNVSGDVGITSAETSLSCVADKLYTGTSSGGHPGFGGPKTTFSHGGGATGALEKTPHGDIHVAVGGNTGLMSLFETAALDPIFWLHHANIDRLWEVWQHRNPGVNVNPVDPDWRNAKGAKFQFHDATGAVQVLIPSQVEDTTASLLGYKYEDIADPLASPPVKPHAPAPAPMGAAIAPLQQPAELVGATAQPHALAAGASTAQVALQPVPTVRGAALTSAPAPTQVYLNLENITGVGRPGAYAVYLNMPVAAASPSQSDPHFAGTLPMFGLGVASSTDLLHEGSGLTYVLDVTHVVAGLKAQGHWDPSTLNVTFVPLRPTGQTPKVQVGRISLYYGD
ncbi:tyrosinase family protein [Silvimonas soli]|uniref:tyrosinase family protein n=1 Tax=Silvimonas soli TaxID=2980100 RepID=UPI0024B37F66|nr:tyrosinase family protein [Silvimonas soli]